MKDAFEVEITIDRNLIYLHGPRRGFNSRVGGLKVGESLQGTSEFVHLFLADFLPGHVKQLLKVLVSFSAFSVCSSERSERVRDESLIQITHGVIFHRPVLPNELSVFVCSCLCGSVANSTNSIYRSRPSNLFKTFYIFEIFFLAVFGSDGQDFCSVG